MTAVLAHVNHPAIRNVLLLSAMFFLIFFSYTTILVHETTLNGDLGTVVLGVGFGVYAFCNTFVSFVQKLLGSRLSLALGTASYVCFMVAHLYPQPVLLISSAVVLAIGASLLWNAQASFLAMHGDERSFGLLAGIFYFFYAWTAVAGNLFSAVFFEHQGTVTVFIVVLTVSVLVSYIPFALLKDPRTFRPFTTLDDTPSLSLMCSESQSENGGVALIHGQLGNDVNNNDGVELIDGREEGNDVEQDSSMRGRNAANDVAVSAKITETLRLFGDTRMLRMVPLMCWFGFATAFWYGGVPARVVVVSDMKQAEIGWLNTAWGVSNAVSAIAFGALGDRVPRAAVVCVALAISFLGCVLSHFFAVHRSVAFFVAVLFGCADATVNTQLFALLSVLFHLNREAAFGFSMFIQTSLLAIMLFLSLQLSFEVLSIIVMCFATGATIGVVSLHFSVLRQQ